MIAYRPIIVHNSRGQQTHMEFNKNGEACTVGSTSAALVLSKAKE